MACCLHTATSTITCTPTISISRRIPYALLALFDGYGKTTRHAYEAGGICASTPQSCQHKTPDTTFHQVHGSDQVESDYSFRACRIPGPILQSCETPFSLIVHATSSIPIHAMIDARGTGSSSLEPAQTEQMTGNTESGASTALFLRSGLTYPQ